jgi:hypothetical protein
LTPEERGTSFRDESASSRTWAGGAGPPRMTAAGIGNGVGAITDTVLSSGTDVGANKSVARVKW